MGSSIDPIIVRVRTRSEHTDSGEETQRGLEETGIRTDPGARNDESENGLRDSGVTDEQTKVNRPMHGYQDHWGPFTVRVTRPTESSNGRR